MTDPFDCQGHGPSDPRGYLIRQSSDGYWWLCRSDNSTAGPFGTREEAVISAEAHRIRLSGS